MENRDLQISEEELQLLIKNQLIQSRNWFKIFSVWQSRPKFNAFCYFLFAPTLIYRNSYVRTKMIRWNFVLNYCCQMIFILVVWVYIILSCTVKHHMHRIGSHVYYWRDLYGHLFTLWIVGVFNYYCFFYTLFHLWHNITGELLRFADRHYYEAFWNARSLKQFYRQWNLIVQDWVYHYAYKPINQWTNNRWITTIMVTFVSAVAHEYIIAISLRFCFPLIFLCFGFCGCKFFVLFFFLKLFINFQIFALFI